MLPFKTPGITAQHGRMIAIFKASLYVFAIVVISLFVTKAVGQYSESLMCDSLLKRARMAAAIIDYKAIRVLTGSPEDIGTPAYNHLYRDLVAEQAGNEDIRDIYLFGVRNGQIIYLLDTDVTLDDPITPGIAYNDATPKLQNCFQTGKAFYEMRTPDKWGVWMSGLVPIHDPYTGKVIAVLGIDVDAKDWDRKADLYRIASFSGSICLCLLITLLFFSQQRATRWYHRASLLESRYHDLFDHTLEAVFLHEPDGHFLAMNSVGQALVGYTTDELAKMSLAQLLPVGQEDPIDELRTMVRQGRIRRITREVTLESREGWHVITELRLQLVTERGKPDIIEGFMRDITARKTLEIHLTQINECFLAFGPDPRENINRLTMLAGKLLGANLAIYNHVTSSSIDIIGQWCSSIQYHLAETMLLQLCSETLRHGQKHPLVVRSLGTSHFADHDPLIAEHPLQTYLGYPVYSGDTVLGTLSVAYIRDYYPSDEDITMLTIVAAAIAVEERRLHAEEALRWDEALLRSTAEASPQALYVVDHCTDTILYANRHFCELWGIPHDLQQRIQTGQSNQHEVVSFCLPLITQPERITDSLTATMDVDNSEVIDSVLTLTDGRTLRWYSSRMLDKHGQYVGRLYLFEDITSFQKLHEDLQHAMVAAQAASQAKSDFLANMSHEIRTPLNGIIGISHLLMDTSPDAQQQYYSRMLLNSSEVLLEIINNILDFSKIEAGKMELDVAPFSIIETVEGLMQTFAQRAGAKGIELILDLSPDLPTQISGDKTRIRQVLMNLIGNAIKFTEAGEIVVHCTVHTQAQHQRLRCMITDSGIGIPEDLADRLFQSFSQLDASTTRKFGGSGLGLVICKRLVTMMGGEIGYTRNTDKGTTFWFTLPLKAMVSDKPEVPDVLRQFRILVVDDNATCCAALTEQLTAWGCQAVSITNAYLAPKLLQNAMKEDNPFTLVLLDETMPGIDCSSLLSRIRTSTHFPCPAIILMRSIGRENPDSVGKLPSLPVLFKPIGPVALRMAILATSEPQNMHEQHARREQNYHPRKIGTILVAEDNTVNQIVIHDTLQRFGHHCDIVQNGQQAIEAVQRHHYDVIIMDCQMPEMDGYQATQAIRAFEHTLALPPTPIIALTATALAGEKERCLAAGMDDYLVKPIIPARLDAVIENWLAQGTKNDKTPAAPTQNDMLSVDYAVLLEYCGGNADLANKVLQEFNESTHRDFAKIQTALHGGNLEEIAQLAHRIKGNAALAGAEKLRQCAEQLEHFAKGQQQATLAPAIETLGEMLDDIEIAIQRIMTTETITL